MTVSNANVGTTSKLIIPQTYFPKIYDTIKQNAVIPTLIPAVPQLYDNKNVIYMTDKPKAEYVNEGAAKHSSDWGFDTKPMAKFKLQTTIRFTEEVEIADGDSSLELLDYVFAQMGESLGEGVDAGMIHAINPIDGSVMDGVKTTAIAYTANQITSTGDYQADIDALPDSLIQKYNPNGIALDNMFANSLRKMRNQYTGAKLYPEIPLSLQVGNFEGLKAVTSANVSGRPFGITDSDILAIIGDWNMAQWGVIREMTLRRFDVGDPDGRGYDLSQKNEVAFRVEMLFVFGKIFDDAFAVLREAETESD